MRVFTLVGFVFTLLFTTLTTQAQEATADCDDSNRIYKVCSDQVKMYKDSSAVAIGQSKLVLITFGADWCPWCKSINKIFSDQEFWSQLDSSVVRLDIGVYMYDSGDIVESGKSVAGELLAVNHLPGSTFTGSIPTLAVVDPSNQKAVFITVGEELEDNSNGEGHDRTKVLAAILSAIAQIKK